MMSSGSRKVSYQKAKDINRIDNVNYSKITHEDWVEAPY